MQAFRLRIRTAIWIVCAIAAPMPAAMAGAPLVEELAWLPGDVDMALGVRDMTRLRSTPIGAGATQLIKTGILLGGATQSETLKAWRSFSERLGFTEDQAFDALLGERFFYASRERDDGENDWVMYSRTTVKTARLVRRKLDVAPREIKHDRVLMSLEGGAFRLGSLIENDGAWLMLAPTDRDGLFEQITSSDGQPEWENLGSTNALEKLRTLGDGELSLYITLDDGVDELPAGWLGAMARARGESVSFALISDPGKPLPAVEPWSTSVFDELRDGSLLTYLVRIPTGDDVNAMGRRNTDSVWEAIRDLLEIPHRILGQDLNLILGHRLAIVADAKAGGGLSLGAGIEASDVRALAAPGDAVARFLAGSIDGIYKAHEASFEFVGTLPRAVRKITFKPDQAGEKLPPFGDEIELTWSFRDSPGVAPAGWWVLGSDEGVFARCAGALTELDEGAPGGETASWLTLIEAHPASFFKSMRAGGARFPEAIEGLESVESLWMRTWIADDTGDDLVLGAGSIRLNEPTTARRRHKRPGQ